MTSAVAANGHHATLITSQPITPAAKHVSPYAPLNFSKYLSRVSLRREESPLRGLQKFMGLPNMISLGGGLPNTSQFPFADITVTFRDGTSSSLTQDELHAALQYSQTGGLTAFNHQLHVIQQHYHAPPLPHDAWAVTVCNGSQQAMYKTFEMLLNEGDAVIFESPAYSGAMATVKPLGCTFVAIDSDEHGLIPAVLDSTLAEWNETARGAKRPHVLYTVPTGQNPAGTSLPLQRKQEIYDLAVKYDLIIIEDDPYFFLDYGLQPAPTPDNEAEFKRPSVPSIWSLDTQGRVIRLDSLSKVVSAGIRIGFATGAKGFIDQINLNTSATDLHSSGVSQMLTLKFLQHVGLDGWDRHVNAVSLFYCRRRDAFIALCHKYLTGLATWTVPSAGMFVWIKIIGATDTTALIEERARAHNVLLVPGRIFDPLNRPSPFVRASFSSATMEHMEVAVKRFADVLKDEVY